MEIRVNKASKSRDSLLSSIRAEINRTALKVNVRKTQGVTGTGNGSDSVLKMGFVQAKAGWRVVGIGAYVYAKGADQKSEVAEWGYLIGDIGAEDADAFGSFTQDNTANKELEAGDIIYQGIAGYTDIFGLDALASAGAHTWDISGAGAGAVMGEWQTKAAYFICTKKNVANSTATLCPFFAIEYDLGVGLI